MDFSYLPAMLEASLKTLELAFSSLIIGLLFAFVFAIAEYLVVLQLRKSNQKISLINALFLVRINPFIYGIAWVSMLFTTIIRGLPEILVLFFVFYGSSEFLYLITGTFFEFDAFTSGIIALSCIFSSYASQSIRGALLAVSHSQKDAATALGFSTFLTFKRILIPQAVRHAIPGLTNQWMVLLKDTALVSIIGVTELLKQSELFAISSNEKFTWLLGVACIYLLITLLTQIIINRIHRQFQIQEAS